MKLENELECKTIFSFADGVFCYLSLFLTCEGVGFMRVAPIGQ